MRHKLMYTLLPDPSPRLQWDGSRYARLVQLHPQLSINSKNSSLVLCVLISIPTLNSKVPHWWSLSILTLIQSFHCISGLRKPWGVAVTDDKHLVVSEYLDNTVTILDRKGKKVKSFEDVEFCRPHGVAITRDNFVIVVDNHKDKYGWKVCHVCWQRR